MKKIAVLTSSRADYGIYFPLLAAVRAHPDLELEIIAFGSHLSPYHGYTLKDIEVDGFKVNHKISSLLLNDDENSLATSIALTAMKFSDFWKNHSDNFDLVFCLGDRYEMFGAVTAGIPFGVPFAHIHAGETTLGAIDNIYRHAISLASKLFFTSAQQYSKRVKELTGCDQGIILTGALSLDNLEQMELYTREEFQKIWKIDLEIPTLLVTIHPETIFPERNHNYSFMAEKFLEYVMMQAQIVITMPNTDTFGSIYRNMFQNMAEKYPARVKLIENFGARAYFSCLKYSKLVAGNSSSGIIEAASFGKYVLNIGDRQKGRVAGTNIIHVPFDIDKLQYTFDNLWEAGDYKGDNPYYHGGAVDKIISELEKYLGLA